MERSVESTMRCVNLLTEIYPTDAADAAAVKEADMILVKRGKGAFR